MSSKIGAGLKPAPIFFQRPLHLRYPAFTAALALATALLCLYSVSLGHNFLFDEEAIILNNPLIRQISSLPKLFGSGYFFHEEVKSGLWLQYYRPLTSMTFSFDYFFWKWNPLGYNLTNLALHMAICWMLFFFLAGILKNGPAAFLASVLYGVLTIHTEAVTYIASRGDLLGALAVLLGLVFYRRGRLGAALGVYALGLFAKESTLLFPAYVLLLEGALIRSRPRRLGLKLSPFVLVALAYLVYRKFFCPVPFGPPSLDLGASVLRVLSMGLPLLSYLRALVFPEPFKYCGQIHFAGHLLDARVLATLLLAGLFFWAWARAWRRSKVVFFGLGLFAVSFLPYSQFVHFYPQWAEHYLHMPALGLAVAAGAGFKNFFKWKDRQTPRRQLAGLAAFTLVYGGFFLFFSYRTFQRNIRYVDSEEYYWLLAAGPTPYAHFGYLNLGRLAVERGSWDKAGVYFKTALAIEPDSEHNLYNIGLYYLKKDRYAEAYQYFKKAYQKGLNMPAGLNNAAVALVHLKRHEDAIRVFEMAQKRSPKDVNIYVNLLSAYELVGRPREGMVWARRGLRILRNGQRDASILTVAMAGAAYRHGWKHLAEGRLGWLRKRHPQAGNFARSYLAEHRRELEHPRVV